MGLRQESDAREIFASKDSSAAVLAERARWLLSEDEEKYVALRPEAREAVSETYALAKAWGQVATGAEEDAPSADLSPNEQLLALGRTLEPDFVWMHPDAQGVHRLAGGVVCFPSAWAIQEKLGLTMAEIHAPVPGLNAELGRQIDTFLSRMTPGAVWRRENWGLSRDGELNHHPSHHRRRLDGKVTLDEVWLRLEHQLLMRLPVSGSVLFGIRVEVVPVAKVIREDPESAKRVAHQIATMSDEAAGYKGLARARPRLLQLLSWTT